MSKPSWTKKFGGPGWIAITTLALSVPKTLEALLALHSNVEPSNIAMLSFILSSIIILFITLWGVTLLFKYFFSPPLSEWLASSKRIAHLDQVQALEDAPFYPESLLQHVRFLNLSIRDFARRTGLPIWASWALIRNRHIIARPELWSRIEEALLLPEGFFQHGCCRTERKKYGEKCTDARLKWYIDHNLVGSHLKMDYHRIQKSGPRAKLLTLIEKEREAEIQDGGNDEVDPTAEI